MSTKCSNIRYARALCSSAGVDPAWMADAVQEILIALDRNRGRFRQAAAARALKRALARQRGLAQRSLPARLDRLKQVGLYCRLRERMALAEAREKGPLGAFDYHSKMFAAENGVCPCCGQCGSFSLESGQCSCGFAYGQACQERKVR
jgi:hypothetical protein